MTSFKLKSWEFRREREETWKELDALVKKAEKDGIAGLSAPEVLRLPGLYRATLSALSVARSISLDRAILSYLESLSARAYFFIYGPRKTFGTVVVDFFVRDFPRAVRASGWQLALASLFLALGITVGFFLTSANEEWFYTFVGEGLAGGRGPTSSTEELSAVLYGEEQHQAGALGLFASYLFTHNARIGLLSFALGFAFGIPVLFLLFVNGTILGAFAALHSDRGLLDDLIGWLFVHGTTEILALLLCAAAGLILGSALAFPGRLSRLDNLARRGREAATVAMGAVFLFFVAGLLEGFARQLVTDIQSRYLIGTVMLFLWGLYLIRSGREGQNG